MIEDFLISGGSLKKLAQYYLSVSVCLLKHFGTWSTNGWADQGRLGFVRRAGTAGRRWCQLQSDWCHMARGTCQRANPCKTSVDRAAGLSNGQIPLKLYGPIATMGDKIHLWKQ